MSAEQILVIAGSILGKSENEIKSTPYIKIIEQLVNAIERSN